MVLSELRLLAVPVALDLDTAGDWFLWRVANLGLLGSHSQAKLEELAFKAPVDRPDLYTDRLDSLP